MTSLLTETPVITPETIRQLIHDVRQPLSGIESIAYLMGMADTSSDSKVSEQLERVRVLVDQANWILEDAGRAVQPVDAHLSVHDLRESIVSFSAEVALGENRNLLLHLSEASLPVRMEPGLTDRMLHWLVQFCVTIAQAADPLIVSCATQDGAACLTVQLTPRSADLPMLAELLDPANRTGYLRTLTAAQGAGLTILPLAGEALAVHITYLLP